MYAIHLLCVGNGTNDVIKHSLSTIQLAHVNDSHTAMLQCQQVVPHYVIHNLSRTMLPICYVLVMERVTKVNIPYSLYS